MRKLLTILLIFAALGSEAQTYVYPNGDTLVPGIQEAIAPGSGGSGSSAGKDAYLYLPKRYDSTQSTRYALIMFYHGAGEVGSGGSGLSVMLNQGLPNVIQNGHPPYSSTTPGDTTWFIVYSRQLTFMGDANAEPVTLYDYRRLIDYYRLKIDTTRIYATGLSAGGGVVSDMMMNTTYNYIFAAAIPMSYAGNIPTDSAVVQNIGDKTMWYFHAHDDGTTSYSKSQTLVDWIIHWHPGQATLTSYSGGHCCWTTFYQPTWKWTTANSTAYDIGTNNNLSIYDWALEATDTSNGGATNNQTATDTADYKIIVDTSVHIIDGSDTLKQVTETSGFDSSWVLFDQQAALDTVNTLINSTDNLIYWKSVHDTVTIDLGGYYSLFRIDMVVNSSNGSMYYQYGSPGAWHTPVLKNMSSANRWSQMNQSGKVYTRYLRVFWNQLSTTARVSELLLYGHLISDSLQRYVYPSGGGGGDTTATSNDYQIILDPHGKYWKGDTVFYELNDINNDPGIDSLIDEQNMTPESGLIPQTTYTQTFSSQPKYTGEMVIDLGGTYQIIHEWVYGKNNFTPLLILHGTPPFGWGTDTLSVMANNGWVDGADTITTRYLKVQYGIGGNPNVRSLILYGHLVSSDSLSRTTPAIPEGDYAGGHTMAYFMGVNEAGSIPPYLYTNVAGVIRDYDNQNYMDTSLYEHNIDSINFVFNKFSATSSGISYYYPSDTGGVKYLKDHDNLIGYTFPNYTDSGMLTIYRRTTLPIFAPSIQGPSQMGSNGNWGKNIDRSLFPNPDTTNPAVYGRFSRTGWQLGAAFGKNKYPADSLQFTIPVENGLNLMQYVEPGNEIDGTWKGLGYYSPGAFIADLSAFYDGNNGTMGSRMGIKNADSTIQVVMPGLAASSNWPYIRSLKYWAQYNTDNHAMPFDIYNFHNYTYSPTQTGGTPHSTMSPENYNRLGFDNIRTYWQSFVDTAHEICPRCGVWNTEWGYDRNSRVPNAVPPIQGQDSTEVQANWIARSWVMQSFVKGLGVSVYYMLGNANWKDYDSAALGNYATCGMVDQFITDNPITGNCCITNFYAFRSYYYTSTIFHRLHDYAPDSIIYEDNDSLYEYRYRSVNNPDSVCYILWSGTQTNRIIDSFAVQTGHASTPVTVVQLADKQMLGNQTNTTSESDGTVPLIINETPQMVFTTDAATGGTLVQTAPSNQLPFANAGPDQNLNPSATSTTLTGSGTDNDGTIVAYHWTTSSGASITSPDAATTTVTGLTAGNTYTFTLTVTDNSGGTGSDNVTVTVKSKGPRVVLYIKNGRIILIQ